jgi:hypothetical protein
MANPSSPVLVLVLLAYGKDILGLVGTVMVTIPFFEDWRSRKKIDEVKPGQGTVGLATEALKAIEEKRRREYFAPNKRDLGLISVGLGLLSLSFVLSLIITYASVYSSKLATEIRTGSSLENALVYLKKMPEAKPQNCI